MKEENSSDKTISPGENDNDAAGRIAFLEREVQRLSLIEFQANNPDDYLKLSNELFIALARQIRVAGMEADIGQVWKTKRNANKSTNPNFFILGIGMSKIQQIERIIPISRWDDCYFAKEIEKSPPFHKTELVELIEVLKSM